MDRYRSVRHRQRKHLGGAHDVGRAVRGVAEQQVDQGAVVQHEVAGPGQVLPGGGVKPEPGWDRSPA